MEEDKILDAGFEQGGLHINGKSTASIKEIAMWAKFLSIVGFVLIGLMVLGLIYMMIGFSSIMSPGGAGSFITFAIILAIYIFPTLKLFHFSSKSKIALKDNSSEQLSNAFSELQSFFRFVGIFMTVILIIYGAIFLFGGAAAILNGGF